MTINKIQTDYIQKSRLFLYPALGIERGTSIAPEQTYMLWEDVYSLEDCKLICVYRNLNNLEKDILRLNKFFYKFHRGINKKTICVFDLSSIREDFIHVTKGHYTAISKTHKLKILEFFEKNHFHHAYMMSYLEPTHYIPVYAKLLQIRPEILIHVGQLCSKPNLIEEDLKVIIKNSKFESSKSLTI